MTQKKMISTDLSNAVMKLELRSMAKDTKKVFFKQNLSSNELLNSIYAAKIIIEGLWRQDLIHKDDITVEMFKLVIQGQTVNANQPPKTKRDTTHKNFIKR